MKHTLLLLLAILSYAGLAQTEDGFSDDAFAGEGVSSGMVYAEMSVFVKNERAKITFDFGTEEDAKELRKEALWDKELQKETEFKSTVDAIKHLEAKQWMIKSTSVAMDNGEIYKYFLLEKMNGF